MVDLDLQYLGIGPEIYGFSYGLVLSIIIIVIINYIILFSCPPIQSPQAEIQLL